MREQIRAGLFRPALFNPVRTYVHYAQRENPMPVTFGPVVFVAPDLRNRNSLANPENRAWLRSACARSIACLTLLLAEYSIASASVRIRIVYLKPTWAFMAKGTNETFQGFS